MNKVIITSLFLFSCSSFASETNEEYNSCKLQCNDEIKICEFDKSLIACVENHNLCLENCFSDYLSNENSDIVLDVIGTRGNQYCGDEIDGIDHGDACYKSY
ncbi:MAG: hypothetical protein AAGB12_11450 [Pseudomonadota bacterium]